MTRLVHHAIDTVAGELSPFVQRIHDIAKGSELRIACPYLGLRVLRPILAEAKSWRLLTDAEELLRSHAPSQRAELLAFLLKHERQVRHCPDLHAKVVAGNTSALVGSANLMEMGLGRRQEMGVALDDPALVVQLHGWFDGLWNQCQPVPAAELDAFVNSLPRGLPEASKVQLTSSAPKVSARVVPVSVASTAKARDTTSDEDRLRTRLGHAASREWIEGYLGMCADLLRTLEIEEDDARLVMSVPKGNVLPVTINQRYVLSAFHRGRTVIGLMLPPDVAIPPNLKTSLAKVRDHLGSFEAWNDEEAEEVPSFGYFEVDDPRELAPLRDEWLFAVLRETERAWKRSGFRTRNHVPTFHRAVVDRDYLDRILLGVDFAS
jgi:hypothetical protein